MKEELGMSESHFKDHVILCEWNHQAANIIQELRLEQQAKDVSIVLIADCDRQPIDDAHPAFIRSYISEVFLHMKQTYESIVVALQKGKEGEVISSSAPQIAS